jgi:hypothetical protein
VEAEPGQTVVSASHPDGITLCKNLLAKKLVVSSCFGCIHWLFYTSSFSFSVINFVAKFVYNFQLFSF